MTQAFQERRRDDKGPPSEVAERLGVDRRQFPPPDDLSMMTEEAQELLEAIDAYKMARGLERVTVPELLNLLEELGYRRN